ncbi:PREDICTED: suppressor protein SRP40 isoform X1 [Drosophila arizonae]|uniref:Suppressor protein SRP40 isoform X1 n=1 Tax=Drosophila arizonae TaxID=7263 RepID=A0ABM1P751_DROAR|nr:PREDICTED: suppressor protein SRP40 isoform X1 [Drosophila arizonae]
MVNELNKPQDNAALSELLAASNRQLEEMQEEHRQLQAELTRLSAQRQQLRIATREQESVSVVTSGSQSSQSSLATAESVATEERDNATTGEDKEETANYLQEKLAEIANLKAQFKRVQHMTDSTKRIEEHISSMESKSSSSSTVQESRQTMSSQSVQSSSSTSTKSSTSKSALSSGTESSTSQTAPDNAELLNAMINMVTDFTSDLRGQEESLRAERLRIKALKEEIIQRKQSK